MNEQRGPKVSMIVAADRNGAIGRGGAMPWHLPDDLRHFKQQTLGKPILMGRRTFDSIGKVLPGRRNLVLSRSATGMDQHPEVELVASLQQALDLCVEYAELMVIGGGEVYTLALPLATTLWLTEVDTEVVDADAWFPHYDPMCWQENWREVHAADARNVHARINRRLQRIAVG
jgi:dihydrofolate reductase